MGRLLGLAQQLRKEGLNVVEFPGWDLRGPDRDGEGRAFNPKAVVVHHTAGGVGQSAKSAADVLVRGNDRVPGPLAQIMVDRQANVWLIASGKANHAGEGGWRELRYSVEVVGIEIHNNGVGEEYPEAVAVAVLKTTAVLLRRFQRQADYACSHQEWVQASPSANRRRAKIDPAGPVQKFRWGPGTWNMGLFRADLFMHMTEEEDMPLNVDDLNAVELRAQMGLAKAIGATSIEDIPNRLAELVDEGVRRVIRDERSALHRGLAILRYTWETFLEKQWPPRNDDGSKILGS